MTGFSQVLSLHSDKPIAELITDGCNMGVKSLNQYLNQYQAQQMIAPKTLQNGW